MTGLAEKARFKALLDELTSAFDRDGNSTERRGFIGAAYKNPLEHTTRRFFIDELLIGLGWNLNRLTSDVVEEARLVGKTTLRMDYLGVNPLTSLPLLIVEAKAWERPFVARSSPSIASSTLEDKATLIAEAVEHQKRAQSVDKSPVIHEWAESIEQLYTYVNRLHSKGAHRVQRVAITSGQWLVIFTSPHETFVNAGVVSTAGIRIFEKDELVSRSDEIFDLLDQRCFVPPDHIEPAQITTYTSGADVSRVFRALWIARRYDGASFDSFPQINLYPAIVVERKDKQLITVIDTYRQRQQMPHSYGELAVHLAAVAVSSDELLAEVCKELDIEVAAAELAKFPGFVGLDGGSTVGRAKYIMSARRPNEYLFVTGDKSHFLLPRPSVAKCIGHSWSNCHAIRQHQGASAQIARTYMPASFFTTTEEHHCAHRKMHQRREKICQVSAFEEFLCCRTCVLQDVCWSSGDQAKLPCGN